ncbi:MAG: type II secretion system protein [Phycisphaerae bacterium]
MNNAKKRNGFSLIELVIVVVIIGIVAAIAIPRLSRGSAGANESALKANLSALRNAIEMFATEHDGNWPDQDDIEDQLTQYTDASGGTNPTRTNTHIYGPYIRKIPSLPIGPMKGESSIGTLPDTFNPGEAAVSGAGWLYNANTGEIRANTGEEKDPSETVFYSEY